MKRFDILPIVLLLPVVGFVAHQAIEAPRITSTTEGAVVDPATRVTGPAARRSREVAPTRVPEPSDESLVPDPADTRRRLLQSERGTYISEILRQRDSALARWPERVSEPVRIWISSADHLAGWHPAFRERVQDAFAEWAQLDIPLRFTFVFDSADADVRVSWVHRFAEPISGKTLWARDRHWWIVDGTITLALHHSGGDPLDGRAMRAIALHEVGHLLGLDHTADTASIMTPRVRVRELSENDRATLRLLYTLPPGSVK